MRLFNIWKANFETNCKKVERSVFQSGFLEQPLKQQ